MDSSLFDSFLDEKNFILAYKRVAANGSMGGIDRVSVEKFGRHLERNIWSKFNGQGKEPFGVEVKYQGRLSGNTLI